MDVVAVLLDCMFTLVMPNAVGNSDSSVPMLLLLVVLMIAVFIASDKANTGHIVL